MANPFGSKSGDPFTSEEFLSGWCPECGRRRGTDARCKNCDPWWTSPLVQAGVPVLLGACFVLTTASALLKQTQKPVSAAVIRSDSESRLVTVTVERPEKPLRARAASVAPVVSPEVLPPSDLTPEAIRIQREGAYINAVLRAQDEAIHSQQVAARNREIAIALQQRMQMSAAPISPQPRSWAPPFPIPTPSNAARLDQLVTEDTVVVPL